MSKRRPKTKLKRGELFVRFEFWELETEAFQHLSADATRVYLFMRKRYNGSNNGGVVFSHRDAQKALRSGKDLAAKALAELQARGFVKRRNAGMSGPHIRLASEWQLTAFECGGQPASKDFARWKPDSEKHVPTPRTGAPRPQDRGAPLPTTATATPESAKSAPRTGALDDLGRPQDRYTCRYTTQGGPENGIKTALLAQARGNRRDKAEWLRAHLDAGVLTNEAVACALEIQPAHVDEIATGKSELGASDWRKLATLAAERLH